MSEWLGACAVIGGMVLALLLAAGRRPHHFPGHHLDHLPGTMLAALVYPLVWWARRRDDRRARMGP